VPNFKTIFKTKNTKYLPNPGDIIEIRSSQFPTEPTQIRKVTKVEFPIVL